MRIVVVRHHDEDDPGFVADAFAAHGAVVSVHRLLADGPLPDPSRSDHLVVLGATWSVYDERKVGSWIGDEMAWVRHAGSVGTGVLGICFGAQVLAAAFGGAVEAASTMELGWTTVEPVTPPVTHTASTPLAVTSPNLAVRPTAVAPGPWLEFHGDRCVLPPAATLLARTELCAQAFTVGRCLGVQFHPEVDAVQVRRWLDSGSADTVVAFGMDPEELVEQTRAEEPYAQERAARLVDAYPRRLRLAVG